MITVRDYVEKYDIFETSPAHKMAGEVFKQAIRHTRRCAVLDLLEIVRPNEDPQVKKYQQDNRRMVTKKGFNSFVNLITRIMHETEAKLENTSDLLRDFLDTNPFPGTTRNVNIDAYFDDNIFPYSLEDPNGLIFPFPYNPQNPDLSLSTPVSDGGLPQNQEIGLSFDLISYDDVLKTSDGFVAFKKGKAEISRGTSKSSHDVVFLLDNEFVYRYYPVGYNEKGKVQYELQDWYNHACGFIPVVELPGRMTRCENNADGAYKESFMHGAFEYYDEGLQSFHDNIAVRVQHNHPKVLMSHLPCPGDGKNPCLKGKVRLRDNEGAMKVSDCSTCGGAGHIVNPGPFGVLIKPDLAGLDDKGDPNPYQFITPPIETINNSLDVALKFFELGDKSIGIDLLESLSESGVAKEYRLEPIQDILRPIGKALLGAKQHLAYIIECYLVKDPKSRTKPVINIPNDYKVKGLSILQREAKESLPSDRIDREIAFYSRLYRGDTEKIKAKKLALMYSPLLTKSEAEITRDINLGAYDFTDIIKRDRAFEAIEYIAKIRDDFMFLSIDEITQLADEYIASRYLPVPKVQLIDTDTSADPASSSTGDVVERSPLLNTVGGATAIVQIAQSVRDGALTERAAINTIKLLFQVDEATASSLLDVPERNTPTDE